MGSFQANSIHICRFYSENYAVNNLPGETDTVSVVLQKRCQGQSRPPLPAPQFDVNIPF